MTRLEPCCLCALYELGKALCDAGEYSEALKRFTSALLMAPPEAAQQLRRSRRGACGASAAPTRRSSCTGRCSTTTRSAGRRSSTARACTRARQLGARARRPAARHRPGQQSAEVYNDRGVCSYETGAFDKALEDFNQAIELNPSYAQAYTNRGNRLRKQAMCWRPTTTPRRSSSTRRTRRATTTVGAAPEDGQVRRRPLRLFRGGAPRPEVRGGRAQPADAQQRVADVEVGVNAPRLDREACFVGCRRESRLGGGVVGQEW